MWLRVFLVFWFGVWLVLVCFVLFCFVFLFFLDSVCLGLLRFDKLRAIRLPIAPNYIPVEGWGAGRRWAGLFKPVIPFRFCNHRAAVVDVLKTKLKGTLWYMRPFSRSVIRYQLRATMGARRLILPRPKRTSAGMPKTV